MDLISKQFKTNNRFHENKMPVKAVNAATILLCILRNNKIWNANSIHSIFQTRVLVFNNLIPKYGNVLCCNYT